MAEVPSGGEREILTWAGFGGACRHLASAVAEDGYRPDIILAIARGGLFVAGGLGYALSVKNIYLMNVEYYTGVPRQGGGGAIRGALRETDVDDRL